MEIRKCKWKYNSKSPVMFMIDDLANKYIYLNENNENQPGCDWGAKGFEKNSFWSILDKEILSEFPHLKTTIFFVVGRREPIIKNGNKFYSEAMDAEESFVNFIKDIAGRSNVELAYHGYTHGIAGESIDDFKEEWEIFEDINSAVEAIEKGKKLYEDIINKEFKGGKYCGYKYNNISDESINKSGFLWWCRHWDNELFFRTDNQLSLEVSEFGNVVDIPSTIDGSFYSLKNFSKLFTKKYIKSLYYALVKNMTLEKQIRTLIDKNQVISVQEHTAPYRVDDRIQYPNIVYDKENLVYIFNYLKNFDLWYATGTEIAEYYLLNKYSKVALKDNKVFIICDKDGLEGELTVEILCEGAEKLVLKNEEEIIEFVKKEGNRFVGELKIRKENIYNMEII